MSLLLAAAFNTVGDGNRPQKHLHHVEGRPASTHSQVCNSAQLSSVQNVLREHSECLYSSRCASHNKDTKYVKCLAPHNHDDPGRCKTLLTESSVVFGYRCMRTSFSAVTESFAQGNMPQASFAC